MKFFSNLWRTGDLRPASPPPGPGPRDGERGVALLLTLGILSLLLILAMSFAFSTRVERMAAAVNADLTRARLLAESGLDRAMAYIKTSYPNGATTTAADLYPATKTGTGAFFFPSTNTNWVGRYYAVSMNTTVDQTLIESALAVNLGFDFTPKWQDQECSVATERLHPNASWHHINSDGNGDGDTIDPEDPLVGRIAFLVVDESGKIDPNAVLTLMHEPTFDTNGSGGYDAGDYFADVNGDGSFTNTALTEGTDEKRIGASPQEINAAAVDSAVFANPQQFIDKLPATAKRWFSWRHLFAGGITGMTANAAGVGVRALFPFSQDIEAWNEAGTDKHRFDLAGTDWDGMNNSVASVALLATSGTTADFWTGTPQTVNPTGTTCIPWLRTLTNAAGTSVSNQVIANLIDYSDSDSATTNNYGQPDWSTTPYVGLEKVPYINEVIFSAQYDGATDTLTVSADVELVNIYSGTGAAPAGYLQVVAEVNHEGTIDTGATFTWASPITVNWNSHAESGMQSVTYTHTTAKVDVTINKFKVYWCSAATPATAATLWDYADVTAASVAQRFNKNDVLRATSCQVADPRCNTSNSNWTWEGGWTTTGAGTMLAVNDASDPSGRVSDDAETVVSPAAGLSTAYIRDAPMQSLWELGALHRGEPWRTLNLSKFNSGATYTYTDGDANILDQVKLGGFIAGPGKFNANSAQAEAWRAVLKGVTVNATGYDAPATGTALTAFDTVANALFSLNTTTGAQGNRGAIARAGELSNNSGGISQDTDRKKEEIIGKIANLLTTRQNYFSIIVTAQAVKDIGTVNAPGAITYQAGRYCKLLAESKLLALVYRDAFANKFTIERIEYLDE